MTLQQKLVRLGVTSSTLLGAAFFPQLAPALGMVEAGQGLGSLGVFLGCMASVAGGNVANAVDAAFQAGEEPDWVSLENEDLTRAVGKAIASVLALVADTTTVRPEGLTLGNPVKANLRKVANAAAANWLAYLRREDYSALGEGNIAEIITPVLAENPSVVLLAPEEWKDIFVWLNLKAQPGGGFSFPPELYEEVAQALTENFPKALLQVLKEDFAKDGRAYAELSLRLLTGLRTRLDSPMSGGIDPALKADILARVGELETGLRERVEATLREIATEIQSGFGEVCQRLGVVTTGIDQLLAGLGEIKDDLQDIKADVRTLLAQAQQETAPASRSIPSNLPFSATDPFIGRQEQLAQLNNHFQRENCLAICAVAGMGGVGKTELALQYALRFSADYPGGLCWLSCRGPDLGLQLLSFARNVLGLPIPEQGEMADQLAFCWNHWPAGKALLIYDDVSDYSQLQPYLPPADQTRFTALLTSRLQPNRASGIEKIDLEVLSLSEALALLTALVGAERIEREPGTAEALCEWVGRLPLALELMGAYLAESEDLTLGELWEELQTERLNSEALAALAGELRTPLGVAQTFELSWQTLSPEAQFLAVRLSLFAVAPFRWEWVEAQLLESERRGVKKCRDRELLKRSVLQRSGEGIYELHPLLREFLVTKQAGMEHLERMKKDLSWVMAEIAQQVPYTVTLADLAAVEAALPHLAEVAEHLSAWLEDGQFGWPFIALGRVYQGQSQFVEAEKWYRLGVEICQERLGERHPDTATSYNNLAVLYKSMGRYEAALPLHQLALDITKEQLGERHPSTAACYNNLAFLYFSMGRYEEALHMYQLALDIFKEQLGERHPDTAISYSGLASLHKSMGQYEAALPLFELVLGICKEQLGERHPHTAVCYNNLAGLYELMGRYEAVLPLYQLALEICKEQLGEHHPSTAVCYNNLASLYESMGRYEAALPLYQLVLEICKEQLGEHHPDTAQSYNSLAFLYFSMGRYEEALPLNHLALGIRKEQLGERHPDTATSYNNLAGLYESMGQYEAALPLYELALEIKKEQLGERHPSTATSYNNLAVLYRSMGQYEAALPLYELAFDICQTALGADHPDTQACQRNLLQLQERLNDQEN